MNHEGLAYALMHVQGDVWGYFLVRYRFAPKGVAKVAGVLVVKLRSERSSHALQLSGWVFFIWRQDLIIK